MDASYKCTNFGNCDIADRQEVIASANISDPKCPECDGALTPMKVGSNFLSKKKVYIAALIISMVLIPYIIYRVAFPPIADIPHQIPHEEPSDRNRPPQPRDKHPSPDINNSDKNSQPPVNQTPQLENSKNAIEMQERAMVYIQIAKKSKGKDKTESLKNAMATLDKAIQIESENNRCFDSALMNKGMVNFLLDKPNKAVDDLKEALKCNPKHATSNYNLAIVYANQKKIDLALDQIDLAIKNGLTNCKHYREDTDLNTLRSNPEFRSILEQNNLFCLK